MSDRTMDPRDTSLRDLIDHMDDPEASKDRKIVNLTRMLDATGERMVRAEARVLELEKELESQDSDPEWTADWRDPEADAVQQEHQRSAKSEPSERLTLPDVPPVNLPGLRRKARVPRRRLRVVTDDAFTTVIVWVVVALMVACVVVEAMR